LRKGGDVKVKWEGGKGHQKEKDGGAKVLVEVQQKIKNPPLCGGI